MDIFWVSVLGGRVLHAMLLTVLKLLIYNLFASRILMHQMTIRFLYNISKQSTLGIFYPCDLSFFNNTEVFGICLHIPVFGRNEFTSAVVNHISMEKHVFVECSSPTHGCLPHMASSPHASGDKQQSAGASSPVHQDLVAGSNFRSLTLNSLF